MLGVSGLLLGRSLGFPWATALLVLGCVVTTLPMFFSERYYLILGTGHEDLDRPDLRWWHTLTTPFVHGGGWPGTTAHLVINCVLFIFLGTLVERTLGAGRFFLVTGVSLGIHMVLKQILAGGRAHGASGMTWSYLLFTGMILGRLWRRGGKRCVKDPLFVLSALLVLMEIIGLVKHWHLWNALISVPFFLRWAGTLSRNLERIEQGLEPDRWPRWANALGIALPALLVGFTSALTLGAVLGLVR